MVELSIVSCPFYLGAWPHRSSLRCSQLQKIQAMKKDPSFSQHAPHQKIPNARRRSQPKGQHIADHLCGTDPVTTLQLASAVGGREGQEGGGPQCNSVRGPKTKREAGEYQTKTNDGEVTMGGEHETSRAEQGHTRALQGWLSVSGTGRVAAVNDCSTA